jgi:hypothetical protein
MTQNSGPIGSATRAMSQGSSAAIEVDLAQQRECFVDANTGAPQHDDQPAQPPAVQTVAGDAHDRDDLLDGRRIGWIAQALVARRMTRVKPRGIAAGDRRRPAASTTTDPDMGSATDTAGSRTGVRRPREQHHQANSCFGHRAKATGATTSRHSRRAAPVAWNSIAQAALPAFSPMQGETASVARRRSHAAGPQR